MSLSLDSLKLASPISSSSSSSSSSSDSSPGKIESPSALQKYYVDTRIHSCIYSVFPNKPLEEMDELNTKQIDPLSEKTLDIILQRAKTISILAQVICEEDSEPLPQFIEAYSLENYLQLCERQEPTEPKTGKKISKINYFQTSDEHPTLFKHFFTREVDNSIKNDYLNTYLKAVRGDAQAQFLLAERYENGNGIEKSPLKAIKWYEKAAENNNADALNNLGYCYEYALGVAQSSKKAFEYYEKAAKLNNKDALYNLAICYRDGIAVEKSSEHSFNYFLKAAACENPDPEAQWEVAQCYYRGIGTAQNVYKAFEYFMASALNGGNPDALYMTGWCYENMVGTKARFPQRYFAIKYYALAAEEGHSDAIFKLGHFFEQGHACDQSLRKALINYEKAARKGHILAKIKLAKFYKHGIEVPKSKVESFNFAKAAADEGDHPTALMMTAVNYADGFGVEPNPGKAYEYFQKAVLAGYEVCVEDDE